MRVSVDPIAQAQQRDHLSKRSVRAGKFSEGLQGADPGVCHERLGDEGVLGGSIADA